MRGTLLPCCAGGWPKFQSLGLDKYWLPRHLGPLGYSTFFSGKFINLFGLGPKDTNACPKGFDVFDPLTDASVYNYIDFDFVPQVSCEGAHAASAHAEPLRGVACTRAMHACRILAGLSGQPHVVARSGWWGPNASPARPPPPPTRLAHTHSPCCCALLCAVRSEGQLQGQLPDGRAS